METQGIDIRIEGRTIATMQFDSIFTTKDDKPLSRHNDYNDFVGELIIPKLKRGVLSTINNKSDFNKSDPHWIMVFDELNKYPLERKEREMTESKLKNEWAKKLQDTNPNDHIDTEHSVWPSGQRIDVYRETESGKIIIYELKVGRVTAQDVYQLLMYWDGLVMDGTFPKEGTLIVGEKENKVQNMIDLIMRRMTPPTYINVDGKEISSEPYKIMIKTHREVGLTKDIER